MYRTATYPVRLLPDFIIVGTMRGGTTSLYNYLIEHPNIGSASMKEVHFFDNNYQKGMVWYRAQFPSSLQKYYSQSLRKQVYITGEASPYYIFHPHAPGRIAAALPNVKLIALLRNPVDRAFSHYSHQVERGFEQLSFEEALDCEEERTVEETKKLALSGDYASYNHLHYTYLARGNYIGQLSVWMSLFPKEQFLLIKSEDFYKDTPAVLKQALDFLNVPYAHLKENKDEYKQYNSYTHTKMDDATRERLVAYYQPYNARLYEFLGRDFGWDR
jgi:hypothetical protein